MTMRVVSTFSPSSSILHSVKCRLDGSGVEYLVISKPSKLEVFALQPEGVELQCELQIWGMVSSLKAVHHDVSIR